MAAFYVLRQFVRGCVPSGIGQGSQRPVSFLLHRLRGADLTRPVQDFHEVIGRARVCSVLQ